MVLQAPVPLILTYWSPKISYIMLENQGRPHVHWDREGSRKWLLCVQWVGRPDCLTVLILGTPSVFRVVSWPRGGGQMWRAELLYVTFVSKSRASQIPQNLLEPQACTLTVIHSPWDAEKPLTCLYARLLSSLCFRVRHPHPQHFGTFYTF